MRGRDKMGVAALVVVAFSAVVWWLWPSESMAAMVLFRSGLVLGAIWLAWPELQRIPRWVSVTGLVTMVLIARFPALAIVVLPAIAVVRWVMKPMKPSNPNGRRA